MSLTMIPRCLLLPVVLCWGGAQAEETAGTPPLPQPLTLTYALSLADDAHPTLEAERARMEAGAAQQLELSANMAIKAGVEARLLAVEPPTSRPTGAETTAA